MAEHIVVEEGCEAAEPKNGKGLELARSSPPSIATIDEDLKQFSSVPVAILK